VTVEIDPLNETGSTETGVKIILRATAVILIAVFKDLADWKKEEVGSSK
jgi:hypothetical protein